MSVTRIAIIGGGLAGLYAANRLHDLGIEFDLFEARNRLGGRIHSIPSGGVDLGPSWFWPDFQPMMQGLVSELGLPVFEQYSSGATLIEDHAGVAVRRPEYFSGNTSMRIEGGTGRLVQALTASLPPARVHLNTPLTSVAVQDEQVCLCFSGKPPLAQRYSAVWMAMPLRLVAQIQFNPALSPNELEALVAVPTWMAAHAKYVARYATPFWRDAGLSGDAFSRVGPLVELHDACNGEGAALFGFLGLNATQRASLPASDLKMLCRAQLVRLLGDQAADPVEDALYDWASDPFTATDKDKLSSGSHSYLDPGFGLALPWGHLVRLVGSEAAAEQGGYMEGALRAVNAALSALDNQAIQ